MKMNKHSIKPWLLVSFAVSIFMLLAVLTIHAVHADKQDMLDRLLDFSLNGGLLILAYAGGSALLPMLRSTLQAAAGDPSSSGENSDADA